MGRELRSEPERFVELRVPRRPATRRSFRAGHSPPASPHD